MSFRFLARRPKLPVLYVINESTVVSDTTVKHWCTAVTAQLKNDVAPAWNMTPWRVKLVSSLWHTPTGSVILAVLDDADQAGALGYHSTDNGGRAYGRVFAKTAMDYGVDPSTTFSHEVLETWGDPHVDQWADTHLGYKVPIELCDAVEGDTYFSKGVKVSNFVLPAWFGVGDGHWYDHLGTTLKPFSLAAGGYTVQLWPDGSATQKFGYHAKKDYIAAKQHEMARTTRRLA